MATYAQKVAQEITWAKRREEGRKETRKEEKQSREKERVGGRRRLLTTVDRNLPLRDP